MAGSDASQGGGDLFVRQTLEAGHGEGGPLARRERVQRGAQRGLEAAALEGLLGRVVVAAVQVRRRLVRRARRRGVRRLVLAAAPLVHAVVGGDAKEEGLEAGVGLVVRRGAVELHEHVLGQLFGARPVPNEPVSKLHHRSGVPVEEGRKRALVALLHGQHQVCVGVRAHPVLFQPPAGRNGCGPDAEVVRDITQLNGGGKDGAGGAPHPPSYLGHLLPREKEARRLRDHLCRSTLLYRLCWAAVALQQRWRNEAGWFLLPWEQTLLGPLIAEAGPNSQLD